MLVMQLDLFRSEAQGEIPVEPSVSTCQPGAWSAADRCIPHGGAQIFDDGRCIEGGSVPSARELEQLEEWFRDFTRAAWDTSSNRPWSEGT
jgi:hypothetical protein